MSFILVLIIAREYTKRSLTVQLVFADDWVKESGPLNRVSSYNSQSRKEKACLGLLQEGVSYKFL